MEFPKDLVSYNFDKTGGYAFKNVNKF